MPSPPFLRFFPMHEECWAVLAKTFCFSLLQAIRSVTAADPEQTLINALNTWMGSVMFCDSFHADVHAGNLFVMRDGRVAFLDFGIVGAHGTGRHYTLPFGTDHIAQQYIHVSTVHEGEARVSASLAVCIAGRMSPVTWAAVEALGVAVASQDYVKMAQALATMKATDDKVMHSILHLFYQINVLVMFAKAGTSCNFAIVCGIPLCSSDVSPQRICMVCYIAVSTCWTLTTPDAWGVCSAKCV